MTVTEALQVTFSALAPEDAEVFTTEHGWVAVRRGDLLWMFGAQDSGEVAAEVWLVDSMGVAIDQTSDLVGHLNDVIAWGLDDIRV